MHIRIIADIHNYDADDDNYNDVLQRPHEKRVMIYNISFVVFVF